MRALALVDVSGGPITNILPSHANWLRVPFGKGTNNKTRPLFGLHNVVLYPLGRSSSLYHLFTYLFTCSLASIMLPIDAPRANTLPILRFAGHGLIVAALSTHIVSIAYKAAALSPPPARRRSQRPVRNRNAIVLLLLAFLSLTSVSVFAFRWRILSYTQWASRHGHRIPNTLWSGWSGTANDAVGHWWLGDWLADVDLRREADNTSILTPEGFLYTTQHLIGQLSTSIFIGVEGKHLSLLGIASS